MGWGKTADAFWRGEVNVMGGSAVYQVLLLVMVVITVRTDRQTDRHTEVKTVYPPVSFRSLGGYKSLSAEFYQTVLPDAWSCVRACSGVFSRHGCASLTSPGQSASLISATRPLQHNAFTNHLRFQVVLCYCSASLESTAS